MICKNEKGEKTIVKLSTNKRFYISGYQVNEKEFFKNYWVVCNALNDELLNKGITDGDVFYHQIDCFRIEVNCYPLTVKDIAQIINYNNRQIYYNDLIDLKYFNRDIHTLFEIAEHNPSLIDEISVLIRKLLYA